MEGALALGRAMKIAAQLEKTVKKVLSRIADYMQVKSLSREFLFRKMDRNLDGII